MLTDYFLPHLHGGTERAVYEIGRRMVTRGHRVTVLTLDVLGGETQSRSQGIEIYKIPAVSLTKLIGAQLRVAPFALSRVIRIIGMAQPDVVHAHNLYFNLTAYASIIKRMKPLPLVTTLHLPNMMYGKKLLDSSIQVYQKTVGHLIIESSDKLVAVSRSVLRHAILDLRVPSGKLSFIPNGVDTRIYCPSARKPEIPTITFIGRLVENKGPQYLVQAAREISECCPEARIQIVGEGPLKNQLMQQVASGKLGDHIQFLGNVKDILPILHATTIFVRPSLTEGMSLAILEAMACGLPTIASSIEGNAEIIEDRKNGYLVPPANAKALAGAITSLLDNKKLADAMGKNARRKVEDFYDWQQITDLTLELYSQLPKKSGSSSMPDSAS